MYTIYIVWHFTVMQCANEIVYFRSGANRNLLRSSKTGRDRDIVK